MLQTLGLSLSNLIGLLLSIKIDRSYLDAHSTPIVDQLSPTSTTRIHWDPYLCVSQTSAAHCEQQYHLKLKDQSHNYSIEIITDDRIEIQMISRIVMLSTNCSLTTICTHYPVSLYSRSETHLSWRKWFVRQSIQIYHHPHDDSMIGSI